ncbi:MAG: hypothetical protein WD042_06820 [Phycisphaeraceae bacterium]
MRTLNKRGWSAAALAGLLTVAGSAVADRVILVDLGHDSALGPVPFYKDALGQVWNQTTDAQKGAAAAPMAALKDITGKGTPTRLVFNDGKTHWGTEKADFFGGGYVAHYTGGKSSATDPKPPVSDGPGTGAAPELAAGLTDRFWVGRQPVPGSEPARYDNTGTLKFAGLKADRKYTVEILAVLPSGTSATTFDYQVNGQWGDAGATPAGGQGFSPREDGASSYYSANYGAGRIMKWTAASPNAKGELVITGHGTSNMTTGAEPFSVVRLTELAGESVKTPEDSP